MLVNRRELKVEWGHCDPAGIVFYPNYLAWFDGCTQSLFERTGLPLPELFRKFGGSGMPLLEIGAKFSVSSSFGDTLIAETQVSRWGNSSFAMQHRFFKADGKLALEGFEKRVWVGPHSTEPGRIKAQPLPPEIVACLSDASGATPCVVP